MLGALLSTLKGTELWDSVPSVIPLFEKIIGSAVNNMQAENGENTEQQGCCLTFVKPGHGETVLRSRIITVTQQEEKTVTD